jgi:hypothetical protein
VLHSHGFVEVDQTGSHKKFRLESFTAIVPAVKREIPYGMYHSKYNPIERCWGILELHWNGTLLSSVDVMTEWAKTMLWKGIHPIVETSTKVYEKCVILSKSVMRAIEKRLKRNTELPKWDILIEPMAAA